MSALKSIFNFLTKFRKKKFLYLVQTASALPEKYKILNNKDADLLYITWKDRVNGVTFLPNSTWTEGRNRLLQLARETETKYEYYIFMDDDLTITRQSIKKFQNLLKRYTPAIGTPRMWGHNKDCENIALEAHSIYAFDAAMNAFHKSVFWDNLIFPYTEKFDKESWWNSQLILLHLAHVHYYPDIVQFNDVFVENTQHNDYPKNSDFNKIESWIKKEFLGDHQEILPHPKGTKSIKVIPTKPKRQRNKKANKSRINLVAQ